MIRKKELLLLNNSAFGYLMCATSFRASWKMAKLYNADEKLLKSIRRMMRDASLTMAKRMSNQY